MPDLQAKQHITRTILLDMLHAGATLRVKSDGGTLRFVPGEAVWGKYFPSSIVRYLSRSLRRGIVEIVDVAGGSQAVLTDKGRLRIRAFDLEALRIPDQDPWDGKWRMLFFDIPGEKASVRFRFLSILKALGFTRLQNSIYVHPYPCDKEISYLRNALELNRTVRLATLSDLEGEGELRKRYGLS